MMNLCYVIYVCAKRTSIYFMPYTVQINKYIFILFSLVCKPSYSYLVFFFKNVL